MTCQCCPLDLHLSAGPWQSVTTGVLALDCQCCPLDLHPPPPPPEYWPLTASAAPWIPTGVPAPDCRCCPLVPHRSVGPCLSILPLGPPCDCWPLTASAVPCPPPPPRSADPWLPVLPLGPYTGVLTLGCQYCPLDTQPVFRMLRIVQLSPQTLLMCVLLLSVWFSAHKGPCSSGTAGHQQHWTSGLTQPRTCRAAHFVHGKSTRKNSVLSSAGFFFSLIH